MIQSFMRGTRTLAVAAVLGTTAFATAQATEWNKLEGAKWGGDDASAAAGASAGAPAGTAAGETGGTAAGAEIASAFQNLGMEPARAECFGKVLSEQLSADDQQDAAALVRNASNSSDVREAVLNEGPTMVGGFSAADASCPES